MGLFTSVVLEVGAVIQLTPEGQYQVWFQLPDEVKDRLPPWESQAAFIVGFFNTYDAATAALIAVQGIRISIITYMVDDRPMLTETHLTRLGILPKKD